MRSASEFRQMARETLRGNWKLAMGTGLAASLIGAEIADMAPNGISELQKVIQARPEVKNVLTQVFPMRSMLLPWVLLLIWGLMVVIIGGAGQMGYARFHLNLAEKKEASFSDLFSQFSRITDGVAMVFVRGFYIYCWPCLFFVPGFIKTYSYAMTPYVLMEHPEYSANEAITESRRLMDGKKWNLFCLTFSFIGWRLICSIQYIIPAVLLYTQGRLSGVTVLFLAVLFLAVLMRPLNIGYLFLRPYEEAAFAAFYRDVRDEKRQIEEIEMQDKWSENEPEKSENA